MARVISTSLQFELMSGQDNALTWILVAVGVIAVFYFVVPLVQDALDPNPIKVATFSIEPTTFSTTQEATLTITINNKKLQALTVTIFLETSPNVQILSDSSRLPMYGGNYTYQKTFAAEERSVTLTFHVRGRLDVGDASRDYYIKGYFMSTELKNPIVVSSDFTVIRG